MQSSSRSNKQTAFRRGVSFVEFVGCLVALSGGVVLGSMYLGVDVQSVAADLLDKADIEVPAVLRGGVEAEVEATTEEPADSTASENVDAAADHQAMSLVDVEEEASPAVEVAEDNEEEAAEPAVNVERRELTEEEKLVATRVYWEDLNRCLQEEVTNRSQGMKDPGNWQLFDYLIHRKRCHEQAVEAISRLDKYGVDARLVAYSDQALTWQKTGVQLYDRATYLLTDAPAGKLTGPFAQSWQSAATQHRMEERLIQNKHAAVANYLDHKFRELGETPAVQ